tara:strand:+ start:25043 stop:26278 length:1236 start_codon:yes stop_codon:yes gene_type:complete
MNILIINHYAGSDVHGMEYRPYYVGAELVKAGHTVTIVASSFSHVRAENPLFRGLLNSEERSGVKYLWLKAFSYKGNGIGRFINIFSFLLNLMIHARRLVKQVRPDVVINSSTYPMDIWPAMYISKRSNAKLIFELHDLWPLSPIAIGGMSKKHPFIRICQYAEDTIYSNVDGVISLLPMVHEYVYAKGINSSKLLILPNGYSTSVSTDAPPMPLRADIRKFIRKAKEHGRVLVAYAGSLGIANAIDNLINAAKILDSTKYSFVIVGSGHEELRLSKRLQDESISNVRIFPPILQSQVALLLRSADIGYLGAPKFPLYKFGVSQNKLTDYMLNCLPVLNATEAGNNLIDEVKCGFTIVPENAQILADTLIRFTDLDDRDKKNMGKNGREYALEHMNYKSISSRLLMFLEGL